MRRILIYTEKIDPQSCHYGMPWKSDATCFNFKSPDECVLVSELAQMGDLSEITTLVIGCDLPDYSFISEMNHLEQLYIYAGGNVVDLTFASNLLNLQHLYIENSHVSSLEPLKKLINQKEERYLAEKEMFRKLRLGISGICIETDCKTLNGAELLQSRLYVSEVIINGKCYRHW